jgi:hypothetical protein
VQLHPAVAARGAAPAHLPMLSGTAPMGMPMLLPEVLIVK